MTIAAEASNAIAVGESRVTTCPIVGSDRVALSFGRNALQQGDGQRGSNGRLDTLQHLRFRRASADPRRAGSQLGADEPTQGKPSYFDSRSFARIPAKYHRFANRGLFLLVALASCHSSQSGTTSDR